MTATAAPGTTTAPGGGKVLAYLQLGKARVYHHAYGWVLALLLLRLDGHVGRDTAAALALLLVMVLTTQWAGGAADDLGGYRDGSDARNYAGRPARTMSRKPLLTGVLTEAEAVRFAIVMFAVAVASGLVAVLTLDGGSPFAAVAVMLVAQVCSVQYSVGMKLSYRPFGLETTILFIIGCIALLPYWLVAGSLNAEIWYTSALVGLWFLLIVNYGNASDRRGDAEVSRQTLAVFLPPAVFKGVLVLLFLGSVTLLTLLFTTTRFDTALGLATVPVVVLHAVQLYYGVGKEDWRKARFIGLSGVDLGCVGLAVAFLLA
ncbi:prenyltransferase [Streptomyces sp. MP131-18]|uniref:prenyltransferase n=1 Tax=Streptomyces sp. MP131-18 TaxID=1857892 RepID=UPI00097BB384|nr:prenyltransferase [Streptomyces sp. MP131-18]ONK10121.1 1,4-dihydroxy-2-naphthoate octaprenyltransferase [Streptomyces sp. MP131-18]